MDVLKEYLVSLGFDVNANSYNTFKRTLSQSEDLVGKLGITTMSSFAKSSLAVASFVVAASAGIAKFVSEVAEADLEYRKFARSMWISTEAAKEVKISLDAMGATMEDLWLSPELLGQFRRLRDEAASLKPPEEFEAQMRYIRSIQFEITRLKMTLSYASQWISYYLIKYLQKPLADLKNALMEGNETLSKYLPNWTKDIAQFLSWIIRLGITVGRVLMEIVKLAGRLPNVAKAVFAALGAMVLPAMMNPFTIIMMSIVALLLLLDDLFTYMDGGESQFEDFWRGLEELGNTPAFKEMGETFGEINDTFGSIFEKIGDIGKAIAKAFGKEELATTQEGLDTLAQFLANVLNRILDTTLSILEDILFVMEGIESVFTGDFNKWFDKVLGGIDMNKQMSDPANVARLRLMSSGNLKNNLSPYAQTQPVVQNITIESKPSFNMYGTDPYLVSQNVLRGQDAVLTRLTNGMVK